MHKPTTKHWTLVKHFLRYLCGTPYHDLQLYYDSSLSLHAFSDACVLWCWLGWRPRPLLFHRCLYCISWSQSYLLELWNAENHCSLFHWSGILVYCKYSCWTNWVSSLLCDLGIPLPTCTVIYCDNVGATQLL